jgi:hypothetical protein
MSDLQRALKLAELLLAARKHLEAVEAQLKTAKEDVRRLEQEDLPELMQELGLETFKLTTGETIEVKQDIECGISEERRARAHAWLTDNGFGGLIKTEVVAKFGRDERDAAVAAAEKIGGEMVERVHPSTLKSFVKEQMEAGRAIPFDLFAIHPFNRVKITAAKK